MKPAHWSKVAKSLARKYGLDWAKAKTAYKALKATSPRTPSLRMVTALPAKIPAKLKGARTKTAKIKRQSKTTEPTLPPNVALAPAVTKAVARPIPTRQSARNKFEQTLLDYGLPVAAIARNETGKQIAKGWRNEADQQKLAKLLKQGYRQIERDGFMKEQTKKRLTKLMENSFGVETSNTMWNNILKQLYGQAKK